MSKALLQAEVETYLGDPIGISPQVSDDGRSGGSDAILIGEFSELRTAVPSVVDQDLTQ